MKIFQSARYSSDTYLVVGLGNPGTKYVDTRHNAGFEMIDSIAASIGVKIKKAKCRALIAEGSLGGKRIVLAKPQTYMNLSGEAVAALLKYYKIPQEKLIVIYDDKDFPISKFKIRESGSAGGHNGIKNIITMLKTDKFARIRIGIGQPPEHIDIIDHVLTKFTQNEIKELIDVAKIIPEVAAEIVRNGISSAMNKYN